MDWLRQANTEMGVLYLEWLSQSSLFGRLSWLSDRVFSTLFMSTLSLTADYAGFQGMQSVGNCFLQLEAY